MSRRASRPVRWSAWFAACGLALFLASPRAQTIADYSRAQRALLESTMTQAAARSAGLGASAAAAGPAPAASVVVPTRASMPLAALPTPTPAVQVSGVFASNQGALAEVLVNTTPYLVGVGQGVPGTAWQVEAIAVDRVVLSRRGGGAAADAQAARRVFALPPLPTLR